MWGFLVVALQREPTICLPWRRVVECVCVWHKAGEIQAFVFNGCWQLASVATMVKQHDCEDNGRTTTLQSEGKLPNSSQQHISFRLTYFSAFIFQCPYGTFFLYACLATTVWFFFSVAFTNLFIYLSYLHWCGTKKAGRNRCRETGRMCERESHCSYSTCSDTGDKSQARGAYSSKHILHTQKNSVHVGWHISYTLWLNL